MAEADVLQKVDHRRVLPGFGNLLIKENRSWWRTRRWWTNVLAWTAIINGLLAIILWVAPAADPSESVPPAEAISVFFTIFGAFASIGAVVIAQGSIVGEKQSGTAEWVMSNPATPGSFVLSKVVGNTLGVFVIIVLLQSALFFVQISLKMGEIPPIGPYTEATALVMLALFFYITLTIMLGSFFGSRGPVIGIALAVLIGQDLVAGLVSDLLPWLPGLLPQRLFEFAVSKVSGGAIPSYTPLIVTAVASVVFTITAIWRFGREEY